MADTDDDGFQDYYVPSNAWYWIIQGGLWTYVGCLLAYRVLILNEYAAGINYSVDLPGGVPEVLRYASLQWVVYMFSGIRFITPIVVIALVVWRNPKSRIMFNIFYVFLWILIVIDVFVVMGLWSFLSTCNGQGQRNNPCNDLLWQCAPEIWGNPANKAGASPCSCPPAPEPCPVLPTSVADLHPNRDFVAYMVSNVLFLVADLVILSFFSGISSYSETLSGWVTLVGDAAQTRLRLVTTKKKKSSTSTADSMTLDDPYYALPQQKMTKGE